jgi:predicted amidohydrolase YtcJ
VTAAVDHPAFTIVGAEVADWRGGRLTSTVSDVRIEAGKVAAIGDGAARPGDHRVHADGVALLPGLHDHHLHLLAMAAARASVDVGAIADPIGFDEAMTAALRADGRHAGRWLRVVGLHDGHGPVDRRRLDRLAATADAADRPIRVQHGSGAAWVLSSPALAATDLAVECPDGWVHRVDEQLSRRWAEGPSPDLSPVGRRLAAMGVTAVTDATPSSEVDALELLARARRRGELPQRVTAMGGVALTDASFPAELARGPVKVVISDHDLPSIGELAAAFTAAHRAGRPVAVHCVTRVAAVLALAAWAEVGARAGDRIEHGSVLPVELLATIADLGLTVVTQPGFVHARGDR